MTGIPAPIETLSLAQARRIALSAQGFSTKRPAGAVGAGHLARIGDRLCLHQIDSVNVFARAHYLPLFSRLGPYPQALLDKAAWGRKRRLFEYWGHEASLLPLEYQPLLRWRMACAERGEGIWRQLIPFSGERRPEAQVLLARIAAEGPLAASDVAGTRGKSGWWEWSGAKHALEWLFWAGLVTTRERRGNFERVYDLPERVLPRAIVDRPTPEPTDAHRELIARSARALGIATAGDLRDYFRLRPKDAELAIAALIEEGMLVPVAVKGWAQHAFLHRDARAGRKMTGQALLAPFDPLVWHRPRTERLFGTRYRLEIYTPAERRVHGYYVLPFLMNGAIVARVDLKADRQSSALRVQRAHLEPVAPPETAHRLMLELRLAASWLDLDRVEIASSDALAELLRALPGGLR